MELETLSGLLKERTPGLMDATGRYAVLVPLVECERGWQVLYEVRSARLRRQPGEVCFPGGKIEQGESPEACALRETWEELAIPRDHIRLLGRLDFIAHRANFILYPILGVVDRRGMERIKNSPSEVDETFLVPLDHLCSHPPLEYTYQLLPKTGEGFPYDLLGIPRDYKWQPGGETVPVYPWHGKAIWGITGRITRHLVSLIRESGGETVHG